MSWPIWTIWTVNALMQTGLLGLILWHRDWRRYPAFTSYVGFCCCKTSLLMWVALFRAHLYFVSNSGLRVVGLMLMIAVFVEVFAAVFHPYSTLPHGTLQLLKIAFVFLIVLSAATALRFPGFAPGTFVNTVMVVNRSVSIIFCGAFGITALVSFHFGIPWQQRTYGIGTGFLLFMSVDLFTSSLSTLQRLGINDVLSAIAMLGYSLAVITWLVYFARADVSPRALSIEQLQRFQQALDYPARKVESFRETL